VAGGPGAETGWTIRLGDAAERPTVGQMVFFRIGSGVETVIVAEMWLLCWRPGPRARCQSRLAQGVPGGWAVSCGGGKCGDLLAVPAKTLARAWP